MTSLTVAEVQAVLGQSDERRTNAAAAYERSHNNHAGVLRSARAPTLKATSPTRNVYAVDCGRHQPEARQR